MNEETIAGTTGFQAIGSSFLTIFISELGDRTFFICAVLAMKYSRSAVFAGNMSIMCLMIVLSAYVGHAAMLLINPLYIKIASIVIFVVLSGLCFWEFYKGEPEEDEESEESSEHLLTTPSWFKAFWKTLVLVFLAEWGDISQITMVTLSALTDPVYVIVGSVFGIGLCSLFAVFLGRSLSKYLSEKVMSLLEGLVFLGFAIVGLIIFDY